MFNLSFETFSIVYPSNQSMLIIQLSNQMIGDALIPIRTNSKELKSAKTRIGSGQKFVRSALLSH
jgi:hypothetical protein